MYESGVGRCGDYIFFKRSFSFGQINNENLFAPVLTRISVSVYYTVIGLRDSK
jgi:hypothetical protein